MYQSKRKQKLYVSKDFLKQREVFLENISSVKGKLLRMNIYIQVEGAFGVLKQDYGFRRFLMRGKKNIRIEFLLLCFGYNVNKLYNKKRENRRTELLHNLKVS